MSTRPLTSFEGNIWHLDGFKPMEAIPSQVYLTKYSGGPKEFQRMPFDQLLQQVEAGTLHVEVGKVFRIDEIKEAHDTMDKNLARGKIVVLT